MIWNTRGKDITDRFFFQYQQKKIKGEKLGNIFNIGGICLDGLLDQGSNYTKVPPNGNDCPYIW